MGEFRVNIKSWNFVNLKTGFWAKLIVGIKQSNKNMKIWKRRINDTQIRPFEMLVMPKLCHRKIKNREYDDSFLIFLQSSGRLGGRFEQLI